MVSRLRFRTVAAYVVLGAVGVLSATAYGGLWGYLPAMLVWALVGAAALQCSADRGSLPEAAPAMMAPRGHRCVLPAARPTRRSSRRRVPGPIAIHRATERHPA